VGGQLNEKASACLETCINKIRKCVTSHMMSFHSTLHLVRLRSDRVRPSDWFTHFQSNDIFWTPQLNFFTVNVIEGTCVPNHYAICTQFHMRVILPVNSSFLDSCLIYVINHCSIYPRPWWSLHGKRNTVMTMQYAIFVVSPPIVSHLLTGELTEKTSMTLFWTTNS